VLQNWPGTARRDICFLIKKPFALFACFAAKNTHLLGNATGMEHPGINNLCGLCV
jgi:hypothetical protein